MNTKPFSFPTLFLSTLQHAFLLRTHCMLPSYLVTNGELMVHENYPKLNRSVSKALAGCSLGHQSREGHIKKGPGRYPGYHTSVSLIISLASHFQLSYLNWSIEYCRTLFTWLLSAQLLWLLSLFLLSKREIHYSVRKPHSFRACAYSSNSVSTHTLWQYFLYTELLHSPAF